MESTENITNLKCKKCGCLQDKSHLRCKKCKYIKFEIINALGICKLLTFTILKVPPAEFRKNPSYALGVVEFENSVKALGQITTQDNLKIGMELKPKYSKICDNLNGKEVFTYVYEPMS
ncbi:MAG: Zn-ribbon domain-containing OB-fold protein [Promethearchaeota archaeon]